MCSLIVGSAAYSKCESDNEGVGPFMSRTLLVMQVCVVLQDKKNSFTFHKFATSLLNCKNSTFVA